MLKFIKRIIQLFKNKFYINNYKFISCFKRIFAGLKRIKIISKKKAFFFLNPFNFTLGHTSTLICAYNAYYNSRCHNDLL